MSLKNFSELFGDLDSINSTNNKIEVLKRYFLSNEPIDNSWAIYLLCLLYTSPSPRDNR